MAMNISDMHSKAVFLDKDGTLIKNRPFNFDPEIMEWEPGALEALGLFQSHGYKLIVVTNQPGVAQGYFTEADVLKGKARLESRIRDTGFSLDGFYYCPHHPEGRLASYRRRCECRKPMPGLLLKAAEENGLRLKSSWMIGDILDDVEAGRRAGCRAILVENGNETEWIRGPFRQPHYTAKNLTDAAHFVLALEGASA